MKIRQHMIDWLLEIQLKYKIDRETLYLSFEIIDFFSQNSQKPIDQNTYHLTGMISIWIATKFNANNHFSLQQIYKNIGYEKFSKNEIIKFEAKILKNFDYRLLK